MSAEFVAQIRSHPLIGEGSCSVIDECYTDAELVERFGSAPDPVAAALSAHEIWADRMADAENSRF